MLKCLLRKILYTGIKCFQWVIQRICGVKKKKVVFKSFSGKSYSDNPRAISEKLHDMAPSYEIVWLFNDPKSKEAIVPKYVKCVKNNSISTFYELATAGIWVDNFNKSLWTYKSNKQIYIQTFHGDRGFKKVLYDAWPNGRRPCPVLEGKICDYAVVGSEYGESTFKTAMHYNGQFIKTGSPRCDKLLRNDPIEIDSIKSRLNISSEKHILLYAPTFRQKTSVSKELQEIQGINISSTLEKLNEISGKEWVMLVRAHAASSGLKGFQDNPSVYDVTGYEDMADLLLISDILITDYSTSIGDYALMKRPCFLFQDDYEDYVKYDRTFYFDIHSSPYLIAKNQVELEALLSDLPYYDYEDYCNRILEFYGTHETGRASKAVCNVIISQ
ncbi:MAG: CDP-glycerol glycerophosphotransferase family protein [Sphaerochaetaceae bacterium]|nr:CDP-glycerol glycerophosphotransferase family protein [Sphaerochaetaceae bacterium]